MASRAAVQRLPLCRPFSATAAFSSSPFRIACQPPRRPPRFSVFRCQSSTNVETKPESSVQLENPSETWKIKMLYDGECPLCMREVNMLQERNRSYGAIKFVDISSSNYSPEENQGLEYKTVMGRIHAILSDGTIVTDVEAFRRLYEEVGLGWVYAVTKYEPIASIANSVYSFWAKYRLQITGRPSLEEVLELRKKKMVEACSDDKVCKM